MLVDGGAGLNLISPAVIEKLQIPDGDLEETGTFCHDQFSNKNIY